jgi:hypothetical protein
VSQLGWAAVILAVAALVVGVVVAFGLRQPDNRQPSDAVAVEVLDHGSRVRIAVAHCPALDVTEVEIDAEFPPTHDVQSHESQLWSSRPTHSGQWLFDTGAVSSGFAGLSTTDDHVVYHVNVDYDRSTAPAKFKGASNVSLEVEIKPSSEQQAEFDRLSSQSC